MKKIIKKISIYFIVFLVLTLTVYGGWVLATRNNYKATILSVADTPVSFTSNFKDIVLDTVNESLSYGQEVILRNDNGLLNINISLVETKIDVVDNCTDYINDVSHTLYLGGIEKHNGDIIMLAKGDVIVSSNISAVRNSCPQDYEINITLETT